MSVKHTPNNPTSTHRRGPKPEPMVGKRFGALTVTAEAPRIRKNRRVTCQCDCGNTVTLYLTTVKYGRWPSCGCGTGDPKLTQEAPNE